MTTGFIPTPSDFMTIQDFKDEEDWPLPYTSTVGILPYLKRLKGDIRGIELGTARGEGAVYLLENCPIVELVCIDEYKEYLDWNGKIEQSALDQFESIAKINFEQYNDRVVRIKENTGTAHSKLEDDKYDFIFIDADHSLEGVRQDIILYYPKIKKNGIIAVHDTNLQSVLDGIKRAREELKSRQPLNRVKNGVAFWYKY